MVAVAGAGASSPVPPRVVPDPRPNVLIVLTDDQTLDTLPTDPAAMPWFQSQLQDRGGHWLWFPHAVVSTPLCCPSRATILTGRFDSHTGVRDNYQGQNLDDTDTLAVWLHDAGYRTGLVGKYLNFYPWGRPPFIPPGWDRWFAKENADESTAYYDYEVVDQVIERRYSSSPEDYATDVLGAEAVRFVQRAPLDRPWFLYFSPNAPHLPWIASPTHAGAFAHVEPPTPSLGEMNDVRGKPAYVQSLAPKTAADRQAYIEADRNERAMLLSVDDWFERLVAAIAARGELDRTVIVFLTDNGYTLGLHRLDGKRFPYTPSIGVPFAIRTPWAPAATVDDIVSNLDVAGTIAELAGVTPGLPQDGMSLVPALRGQPLPHRAGVFLDWGGDEVAPPWRGVITPRFVYIRNADGFDELYRATDPLQLHNAAGDRAARHLTERGRALLTTWAAEADG